MLARTDRPSAIAVESPSRTLPESMIEQLSDLWCEVLLANLRRHPVPSPRERPAS